MGSVRDEVAKNLLFYRKKSGLSQVQLAGKLGVKNSAISNWEHGTNSIDIDTLHIACEVLKVSMNDMFGVYANVRAEQNTPAEKHIINNYRSLNEKGQEKLFEYAEDLVDSDKYLAERQVKQAADESSATKETYEKEADEFAELARQQFLSEKKRKLQTSYAKESAAG